MHWPVWFNHMPYILFPPTWPVYTPGLKMADWLEFYVLALKLNMWLSSTVLNAASTPSGKWDVLVWRTDGSERVFHVNHVGSTYVMNLDKQWKLLGGSLYSEGAPSTYIADRLYHSMPHPLQENGMAQRSTKAIAAADKELLDKLNAVGFRTHLGVKDADILLQLKVRSGGHYFGAHARILPFPAILVNIKLAGISNRGELSTGLVDITLSTVEYIERISELQDATSVILLILGDGNWKMGEGAQVGKVPRLADEKSKATSKLAAGDNSVSQIDDLQEINVSMSQAVEVAAV
ncbi:hypothetical protein B0H21DRAFT_835843 [Amylocystis lapponica]|nr:hypothetical protein B0H21DRAFT_835843 [Amylocystis lapponica]